MLKTNTPPGVSMNTTVNRLQSITTPSRSSNKRVLLYPYQNLWQLIKLNESSYKPKGDYNSIVEPRKTTEKGKKSATSVDTSAIREHDLQHEFGLFLSRPNVYRRSARSISYILMLYMLSIPSVKRISYRLERRESEIEVFV